MLQYIARRVLQFIPVFLGVTLVLFIMTRIVPGDPARLLYGERAPDPDIVAQIRAEYGLDDPIPKQYADYLSRIVRGDLGTSIVTGRDVGDIILEKYPFTLRLALAAIIVEIVIGIAAGIVSAVKQYSFLDVVTTLATSILVSLPVFWLGMLLQYTFGIWLKELSGGALALPISGAGPGQFPTWMYLILPGITLASVSTAYVARIMRSQLLEVQGQDYIRTALAKGLTDRAVLWRHALKNALIPVVTFIGLDLGIMLSGAILTETVFNWPGIGFTIYLSIIKRDWPVVIGSTIVVTFAFMVINLAVDISYAFFDPRIRYGGAKER